ncbi:MAG: hypothetical protein Q7J38_10020 [Gallionella sp.]|nr:hypothetical protein [Gallionella sp.]
MARLLNKFAENYLLAHTALDLILHSSTFTYLLSQNETVRAELVEA